MMRIKKLLRQVGHLIVKPVRHEQENVVSRRRKKCSQLFILFQGIGDRLMMDTTQFLAQTDLFSRNIIMLRDPHKVFFRQGVSSEIQSFGQLVEWLADYRDSLPHVEEVHCFGTSMGAYAAVLAGAMLKADSVIAMGLMTKIDETLLAQRNELFNKIEIPEVEGDLKKYLEKHNGHTQYFAYYCESFEEDRMRADRIAGLPGVHLRPVPGSDHNAVRELEKQNALGTLFPPFRAVENIGGGRL